MTTLGSNDVVGDASRVVAVTDNRTPQFKLGELLFKQKQCVQASSLPLAPWEVGNDDVVVATRALPISPVVRKSKGIANKWQECELFEASNYIDKYQKKTNYKKVNIVITEVVRRL